MGMGGQRHAPTALHLGKVPGTHCIGGWVGPSVGLDGCGKSPPRLDSQTVLPVESMYRLSCRGHRAVLNPLTLWRRNYFFFNLSTFCI